MKAKRLPPLVGMLVVAMGLMLAGCDNDAATPAPAGAPPPPAPEATIAAPAAAATATAAATREPATEPTPAPTVAPASLAPLPAGLEDSRLLVDTDWLAANIDEVGIRVLDVRSTEEFDSGHIPGAVNVPSEGFTATVDGIRNMAPPAEDFAAVMRAAGVSGDTRVVVADGGNLLWAARMFWTLDYFGHTDIAILHGGMAAWSGEERPRTALAEAPPAGDFEAHANPDRLAVMDEVLDRLYDPDVIVVDTRSPAEFDGEDVRSARGGHIPRASNVNWSLTLNDTAVPTLKAADELRALYEAVRVTTDRTIVTHCQTGVRGSHTYFVLRLLGYENVALYDAGWAEWGNDPEAPIESNAEPATKPNDAGGTDTMDGM